MLNFRKWFEWLFKTFDISRDTKLIMDLQDEGVKMVILTKRSWLFGLLNAWRVLIVSLILPFNIWLLFIREPDYLAWTISSFLGFNLVYWIYTAVSFLVKFRKIYGSVPKVVNTSDLVQTMKDGDEAFTKFFNQTLTNYFVLFVTMAVVLIDAIGFRIGFSLESISLGVLNVGLLVVQYMMFKGFMKVMIDQEMDFCIIMPGKIWFHNQSGVKVTTRSIDADKVKSISGSVPNIFFAFLHIGDINILTEGDADLNGEIPLAFVGNPEKVAKDIELLIGTEGNLSESTNFYAKSLLQKFNIDEILSKEGKAKMKKALADNDWKIKLDYENGDENIKKEIRELYERVG